MENNETDFITCESNLEDIDEVIKTESDDIDSFDPNSDMDLSNEVCEVYGNNHKSHFISKYYLILMFLILVIGLSILLIIYNSDVIDMHLCDINNYCTRIKYYPGRTYGNGWCIDCDLTAI